MSSVTALKNILLQQCTGKVVRLNIQFEITYGTTVVEFSTTTALVVVMERCNFVSAGTETIDYRNNGIIHFMDNISRVSARLSNLQILVTRFCVCRRGADVQKKFPAKKLRI